jgi:hypothetical protein
VKDAHGSRQWRTEITGARARESDDAMVAEILVEGRDGVRIQRRGQVDNRQRRFASYSRNPPKADD